MRVLRVVPDIGASDPARARAFYGDILGMTEAMNQGWIVTFASDATARPQVSIASDGGGGAPTPDLSIEVDDLDEALRRMRAAKMKIVHGPVQEPWSVRRFFVRDPFGRLVNVLTHAAPRSTGAAP